jgi:hypothetical protein
MPKSLRDISAVDQAIMAATREFLKSLPDLPMSPAARPFFDEVTAQVPLAEGVEYQADTLESGASGISPPKEAFA